MSGPPVDFARLRILVVENHALMRRLLHEMLRGFGVPHVGLARNVPQALDRIYREPFDAVILDFFLGDMDGADFARRIRHDPECRNRTVPILLITGMPDHHKVVKAFKAGINGMLAKPIAPRDLYLRLAAMIARPAPFIVTADYAGPARPRARLAQMPRRALRTAPPANAEAADRRLPKGLDRALFR